MADDEAGGAGVPAGHTTTAGPTHAGLHVPVTMPAPARGVTVATLARWFVAEGAEVAAGDVLAEVRSDRASLEVEASVDGRLVSILVPAGSADVPVATVIAQLAAPGAAEAPAAAVQVSVSTGPASPGAASGMVDSVLAELAASLVAAEAAPAATTATDVTTGPDGAPSSVPAATPAPAPAAAAVPAATPAASAAPKVEPAARAKASAPMLRMTYRAALQAALAEEMRADASVFLIGEEVGEHQGTHRVTEGLLAEFGAMRVIDTPITEAGFTGLAIGAAMAGLRPVVEFMSWNFALQALDQIVNSAAKTHYMSGGTQRVPIVLRGPNGAAPRAGAQHAQCLAAWLAHVPGLKVVAPSTPIDAKGLLKSAIRDGGPVVVLEHEGLYAAAGDVPQDPDFRLPIGRATVVRAGRDVTLVSYSRGVTLALAAAEQLASEGIQAEVVDLRSLRPLDLGTVTASVRKTNRLVTVEESWPVCSIGAEICAGIAAVAFEDLDAPPTRVTGADVPMPYAENLERLALPSVDRVVAAARSVLYI